MLLVALSFFFFWLATKNEWWGVPGIVLFAIGLGIH
jgi:uncharacterized membrane protein YccC